MLPFGDRMYVFLHDDHDVVYKVGSELERMGTVELESIPLKQIFGKDKSGFWWENFFFEDLYLLTKYKFPNGEIRNPHSANEAGYEKSRATRRTFFKGIVTPFAEAADEYGNYSVMP